MTAPDVKKSCCGAAKAERGDGTVAASTATAVDPVCGMRVSPESVHSAEHAARQHFFCSAGCRGKFEAELARYVDESRARRE